MTQLVLKPTRVTSNSSKCLDHILTMITERHAVTNVAKISLSDHYLIYTCIHFSMAKHNNHKEVTFRDYQQFDRDDILQNLERSFDTSNLDFEDDMYNIDEKWFKWKSTFTEVCDKHAPLKTMSMKQRYCPWISKELVQLIYKRDFLKRKSDIDPAMKKDYKCIRNRITKLRRDNKRDYTKDVIRDCKKDSKKIWRELNKITGRKRKNDVLPNELSADKLNNFFASVGKMNKPKNDDFSWKHPECIYSFEFQRLKESVVYELLCKLGNVSNLDLFNVDSKLLCIGASVLPKPLVSLYNASLKLKWFSSYLFERSQMVFCHGILSNSKTLSNGIPQGSVLGPILFLLFINDIDQSLQTCICNMFADDVVIYSSHNNIDELTILLQNDIHSIHRWYTQNNLKVNAEKTKIMLLSTRKACHLNIYNIIHGWNENGTGS